MDFLNLIMNMTPSAEIRSATLSTAARLRNWALANNVPVIHCVINFKRAPESHRKIIERWTIFDKILTADPTLADEVLEIKPASGADATKEIRVSRQAGVFSAMKSDGLGALLEERGITSLIMSGVSTNGCVLSTSRAAADEGFVTTVVEDACADANELAHNVLRQHVLPASVNVLDFQTLEKEWTA